MNETNNIKNHKNHDSSNHHKKMMNDFKQRFIISLILTIPILILSPLIQSFIGIELIFSGRNFIIFLLSTIVFFYGGCPFLKGIIRELKEKSPGMMTLIAVAISVAYVYSSAVVFGLPGKFFFWELATLIDVMLLGHYIEMKSVISASNALEKLAELMPNTAHKITNGETTDVSLNEISKGDQLLVKPGEKIPSDATIIKGKSDINESMLTGESKPVFKSEGDEVIGGSVNGDSVIEIEVKKTGEESYLSEVINLVSEAQESKSKTQLLADKAAFLLTIISLSIGSLTFIVWVLLGKSIVFSIERMATVMVITCPHALGLAIPLVVAISTTLSAKNGLLIRNRSSFENARKINTVIFDKTGTLTKGTFSVTSTQSFNDEYSKETILKLAATLEKHSEHPIAHGILEKVEEENISLYDGSEVENLKGEGIKGKINDDTIKIVSPGYLKKNNINIDTKYDSIEEDKTIVFVLRNEDAIGSIHLSDQIREQSYEAIKQLKQNRIDIWMLTGDNKRIAKEVAEELNLDGYIGEILPDEKQEKVKEFQSKGKFVAMTGDGVNDAPALAQADVGIAIGSGTDIAAETADIILVNSNPLDVISLINFGKKTHKKMIQNLFWATGYNVIAIPLAAGILLNQGIIITPAVGAALMSVSTIIVAINARLLQFT
ncbi:MAG: copper-translocating P-type ATPase [Candidatus Lokiarchaeota archaeon]|nr:copper-translocating P-type ATPase [Candidatus Lokiarchaeota archaeon]